jgi:hypothetical protein
MHHEVSAGSFEQRNADSKRENASLNRESSLLSDVLFPDPSSPIPPQRSWWFSKLSNFRRLVRQRNISTVRLIALLQDEISVVLEL